MRDADEVLNGQTVADDDPAADGAAEPFPEFEELRRQIARRIRDNQRFLERIFDEEGDADAEPGAGEEEEESLEAS